MSAEQWRTLATWFGVLCNLLLFIWLILRGRNRHRTIRNIGHYPSGTVVEVIRFSVFAKQLGIGRDQIRTEAQVNTSFEKHMKECKQCREMVLQDMKVYVTQTEKEWAAK